MEKQKLIMSLSLKPIALTTADYPVALKAALGYEKQLFVSFSPHTDLGRIEVLNVNSGVVNYNVADNAQLSDVPQELMMFLEEAHNFGGSDVVVSIPVVYDDLTTATVTGTLTIPAYANNQSRNFPQGFGCQIAHNAAKKVKSINWGGISIAATALALGAKLRIIGMPSLDASSGGTFNKIGYRVSLNYDPKIPIPTAVQDGRDLGACIKAGEIAIGSLEISAKNPSDMDSLKRYLGRDVTGWVKEVKEDKLHVQNIFFLGLYMSAKPNIGESVEPEVWNATAMYRYTSFIVAGGAGQ